jgi:stage II sporulation protein AA (anti-sigma F factor antagonist)
MTSVYESLDNILIVSLEGKLQSSNAAEVEAEILKRLGQHNLLLLDLGLLDYISSAGLRVVLVAAKRLKQSAGKMVLCGIRPSIREVFDISGFLTILDVVENREQALARLQVA